MKVGAVVMQDQEDLLASSFTSLKKIFIDIVKTYRSRNFSEDIDFIEENGGVASILERLKVTKNNGLSSVEDHSERIAIFGDNKPQDDKNLTYCEICWEALTDLTLRILIVSGIISLILGATISDNKSYDWIEGLAIIIAVAVVVNVTGINDFQKQKKFNDLKLQNKVNKSVIALRNGDWTVLHPSMLLVGDLVKLEGGIGIPADGILIESSQIEVVEASMTGENQNIKKLSYAESLAYRNEHKSDKSHATDHENINDLHHKIPSPVVLSGTCLAEGIGLMVVICVGKNSAEGRVAELAEQQQEITPLMKKLNNLAETIGKGGLLFAIVTVAALYLRFIIEIASGIRSWNGSSAGLLVKYLIIGITVLVVAIPEGLPLAVTISLAYSVKKMQLENNLVRKMHACETMGGANIICSDKTGTLTQNKMTVSEFWAGSVPFNFDKSPPSSKKFQAEYFHLLKESIFTNSNALIDQLKGNKGNKTEISLLLLMYSLGHSDYQETKAAYLEKPHKLFPFSSKRKMSSIVISLEDNKKRLHVKGAAEILIKSCSYYLTAEGTLKVLDDEGVNLVNAVIQSMTEKALRVIGIAYKDFANNFELDTIDQDWLSVAEREGLILIALAGIKDPLRDEVPDAVLRCQGAGITVKMVTGDNKATARAIAKECYIITSDDQVVMEGPEFAQLTGGVVCKLCRIKVCPCPRNKKDKKISGRPMRKDVVANEEAFKECVKKLTVLARSSPDDKYTLVCGLKELENVVAVTGDGTNDAPALKKADVGFAMGLTGTEMAKEAADIILLDDNFNSIVRAVVWGRNVYDNIRSFIQFQITVNIVAVISAMIGAITIEQSPLTSVQLLWVNLIMDTLASLALATDPPTDAHLTRKPYKRDEFIIQKSMWKHIFGQSIAQLVLMFAMMYTGENFLPEFDDNIYLIKNGSNVGNGRLYDYDGKDLYKPLYEISDYGPSRHFTYIFNIFVLLQLTNEINCRKLRDEWNVFSRIHKNWLFIVIWIGVFFLQVLIVQLGNYAFSCNRHGLSALQWLVSLAFSCLSFLIRFFLLLIPNNIFPEVIFI